MKRLVTLTQPQRAALVARYRAEKNVHLRDRLHCVLLKAGGRTNRETAAILLTSEHTVSDWLDRYDAGGLEGLCAWDVGGSDPHLSREQTERLREELDAHGFQSAKQVCAWVEAQGWGVAYSERGMRALLGARDARPTRSAGCAPCSDAWATAARRPTWSPRRPTRRRRAIF